MPITAAGLSEDYFLSKIPLIFRDRSSMLKGF